MINLTNFFSFGTSTKDCQHFSCYLIASLLDLVFYWIVLAEELVMDFLFYLLFYLIF